MAIRATWKGSITFGLVSIPVELYTAIQPHVLGFKLLHAECHTPISNKRWCNHCDREIAWEETIKGLKLPDDTYFLMTQENIKKLKPEKTDIIDIKEFVDSEAISPLYYDAHYYVVPQKKTEKAFFLFVEALSRFNKTAIGTFVLRDKDYVTAIQPFGHALLLNTLNYAYEIKHLELVEELKAPKISEEELKLAEMLMSRLYREEFDISEFKDTFAVRLGQAIKARAKGKAITVEKPVAPEKPTASLMDALRQSLSKYNGEEVHVSVPTNGRAKSAKSKLMQGKSLEKVPREKTVKRAAKALASKMSTSKTSSHTTARRGR